MKIITKAFLSSLPVVLEVRLEARHKKGSLHVPCSKPGQSFDIESMSLGKAAALPTALRVRFKETSEMYY